MSIGTNIKKIRESKNLSIDYMAKALKVFKSAYTDVENSIKVANDTLLKKIAQIFGVTVDYIINYDPIKSIGETNLLNSKNVKSQNYQNISTPTPALIGQYTIIPVTQPTIKDIISQKNKPLTAEDIFRYGGINNLVGVNNILSSNTLNSEVEEKTASPLLLNWVESFKINGVNKTLFYTEVNSNLKVGDKVFIINGNYDSNTLIGIDKYKNNRDGYKILFIDKCKIVLDIDYTGVLPFNEDISDNFINLYVINDRDDFIYFSRQITTRNDSFDYKFDQGGNNIVYSDDAQSPILNTWGENDGISTSGFFIKNGTQSWIDISSDIENGTFSTIYDINNRIYVHNGSFTYSFGSEITEFKEGYIYKYEENRWIIDTSYNQPIISKSNFRKGNFTGIFNGGVYGVSHEEINWDGIGTWNLGTLLNTNWTSGTMNSLYTINNSYFSKFENGVPLQKANLVNNNGYGYNYVIDSNLTNIEIESSNIVNSNIGSLQSYSILEKYLTSQTEQYECEINNSLISSCKINSCKIIDSELSMSDTQNSILYNIKSVNSSHTDSLMLYSKYLNEDSIKITGYEELIIAEDSSNNPSHKVYKFYIEDEDASKIKIGNSFYLKGIVLNGDKYPLNFFDKKFKLSTWTEYIDYYDDVNQTFEKRDINITAFLSTPKDNENLYNSFIDGGQYSTIIMGNNVNKKYSIDIFVSKYDFDNIPIEPSSVIIPSELSNTGLNFNNDSTSASLTNLNLTNRIGNIVDISNAYINNSNFNGGIIKESDWISGNYINCNNDNLFTIDTEVGGTYSIIALTASQLLITTHYNSNRIESCNYFNVGDIIFLNNVEYVPIIGDPIQLSSDYKILEINNNEITIEELSGSIVSSLPTGGIFTTTDTYNRYNYLHKLKIDTCKLKSGIFKRAYIINSLIENIELNTSDKLFNNLSNLRRLIISDCIFKNTNNTLSNALYVSNSFATGNDIFKNGIVFRSVWNGMTFLNGLFKESNWINGIFNGGNFYNNRSFNNLASFDFPFYNSNRVKSYYKTGALFNNRYSWVDGTFNGGTFYKGDWENGIFNGGNFEYSNFYNGIINGGIIGNKKINSEFTKIFNGAINYTTVDSATLYSNDPNFISMTQSNIYWYDGIFNGGYFGCNDGHQSIWYDGQFNNGIFGDESKWKYGTFNGGNFESIYGCTLSESTSATDYSWEDGVFNGGVFGNLLLDENSTWYSGQFNGGKFVGRVWNNGIFTNGDFVGSSTYSAVGGLTCSNASDFTDSFIDLYYGKWRDGIVSNKKDLFIIDQQIFTDIKKFDYRENDKKVLFENALWLGGTFSHNLGEMNNCVWLDGIFEGGKFIESSFNPYVKRNGSLNPSFSMLGGTETCRWDNGYFENGDFFISRWLYGTFNKGNAYGMVWEDGICEYMNAFNIYWKGGLWRNGNWYGSYFDYNGNIADAFIFSIIVNIALYTQGPSPSSLNIHTWNIFDDEVLTHTDIGNEDAGAVMTPINPQPIEGF